MADVTAPRRWAITSTRTFTSPKTGQPVSSTHYFKHQARGFFNVFGEVTEAKTWRTKAEAANYLRRTFGAHPGQHGYDVVRING